jgi:hypothetical protein
MLLLSTEGLIRLSSQKHSVSFSPNISSRNYKSFSYLVCFFQPEDINLTANDPRWIGAWWLGFVIFGILIFILSILLLGFPRELPGAKEMREEQIKKGNIRKVKNSEKPTLKRILPELRDLLTNGTFMFNTLGVTATVFYFGAVIPFYPKILSLKFRLLSEKIGYILGTLLVPCTASKQNRKSFRLKWA